MTSVQLDGHLDAVARLRNPSRRGARGRRGSGAHPAQDVTTTRSVSLRQRPPKKAER